MYFDCGYVSVMMDDYSWFDNCMPLGIICIDKVVLGECIQLVMVISDYKYMYVCQTEIPLQRQLIHYIPVVSNGLLIIDVFITCEYW